MINQLFKKEPDQEIILNILNCFGYQNFLEIDQPFCKKDLKSKNTVKKIEKLKGDLEKYYIPCKAKLYLKKKLTEKKAITILRQFLKNDGFYLAYWETYVDGVKTTYYQIKQDKKNKKTAKKYVVSFE